MPENLSLNFLDDLVPMLSAFLLALPIGWEREVEAKSAGLRTFPLVAMASCGYLLLADQLGTEPEVRARVLQGLVTGIGFIGGGAILKKDGVVAGLATATSIWITGAIGASVASGAYEIAVSLSLLTFLVLRWSKPMKEAAPELEGED